MGSFQYVIKDEVGMHARPAGMLVKLAKELSSAVTITKGDRTVEATKLLAIMSLGVKKEKRSPSLPTVRKIWRN